MLTRLSGWPRALLRWVAIAASAYLGMCALIAWQKEAIIFPDHGRERAAGRTASPGYEVWWQTMRDGVRVEGWWRPAPGVSAENPAPAVIVFHGNGEIIDDSRDFADAWNKLGVSVLLVDYRGYGRSEGSPGIDACKQDSLEWFDRLAARPEVRPGLVLAHGYSLGGVFAAELAGSRPLAGLAMEGTVASLRDAARDRHVWVLFTRERFDAAAVLRRLDPRTPVLLTHGRGDVVVPYRHHPLLLAARPDAIAAVGDHGHGPLTLMERPELLRELLAKVLARAGDAPAAAPDKTLASRPGEAAP